MTLTDNEPLRASDTPSVEALSAGSADGDQVANILAFQPESRELEFTPRRPTYVLRCSLPGSIIFLKMYSTASLLKVLKGKKMGG